MIDRCVVSRFVMRSFLFSSSWIERSTPWHHDTGLPFQPRCSATGLVVPPGEMAATSDDCGKQCSYLQSLKMVDVGIRNTHNITPGTVIDTLSLNSTQIHHSNIFSKWKKGMDIDFERCCWRILTHDIVQLHPSEGPDKPSFATLLAPRNEEINQWIGLRQNWNRKPDISMGKPGFR